MRKSGETPAQRPELLTTPEERAVARQLNAFSEAFMQEVRHENIRVSYVLPGSVATEFSGRSHASGADWRLHAEDVDLRVLAGEVYCSPRVTYSIFDRLGVAPDVAPRRDPQNELLQAIEPAALALRSGVAIRAGCCMGRPLSCFIP